MPAEWERHERTWMAWPAAGYMGTSVVDSTIEDAYAAWSNVANVIVRFEPVTMVVDPRDVDIATEWLSPEVELLEAMLDDAWMRDMGPTFVRDDSGKIQAIDWVFNGWGAQHWAKWDHDAEIAPVVIQSAGVPLVASPLVNEGGGIHVNGAGMLLATRTVQFDPHRNPEATQESVEQEFARTLGATSVIWIERGLTRDYEDFGTRGHVDIVACFSDENTILYHDQQDSNHPDFAVTAQVRATLGRTGLKLIAVPAPKTIKDEHGFTDYSYINHYVCNGAVILCAFDDPNDEVAQEIMSKAYPNREIVLVDAREIFARGGGIHCITQQQPAE
ncbi:unannotated protein [freshwater metagenome]|uniref:Unannotated protein n=1 Tax=freshwater metagenome TaxID=449393 RepID=A0A6J5YX94_9ZZZZ